MNWKFHQTHAISADGAQCDRCGVIAREYAATMACAYSSPVQPDPLTDAGLRRRTASELARDLRVRADALCGERWEQPATAAMMREAADLLAAVDQIQPGAAQLREMASHVADAFQVLDENKELKARVEAAEVDRDALLSFLNSVSPSLLNTPKRNAQGESTLLVKDWICIAWSDIKGWLDDREAAERRLQALQEIVRIVDDTVRQGEPCPVCSSAPHEARCGLVASLTQPGAAGQE